MATRSFAHPLLVGSILASLALSGCQQAGNQSANAGANASQGAPLTAPQVSSELEIVRVMLDMAEVGANDLVVDLGSGDGRIPIMAAKDFGARGVGIEIDPVLVERARANAREAGVADRVEFRLGDMYAADLRPATVVTLFLHPEPNLKLRPNLQSQLRSGSRVVSYMWNMGDWKPDAARRVGRRQVYLWRIGRVPATGAWRPAAASETADRKSY